MISPQQVVVDSIKLFKKDGSEDFIKLLWKASGSPKAGGDGHLRAIIQPDTTQALDAVAESLKLIHLKKVGTPDHKSLLNNLKLLDKGNRIKNNWSKRFYRFYKVY